MTNIEEVAKLIYIADNDAELAGAKTMFTMYLKNKYPNLDIEVDWIDHALFRLIQLKTREVTECQNT